MGKLIKSLGDFFTGAQQRDAMLAALYEVLRTDKEGPRVYNRIEPLARGFFYSRVVAVCIVTAIDYVEDATTPHQALNLALYVRDITREGVVCLAVEERIPGLVSRYLTMNNARDYAITVVDRVHRDFTETEFAVHDRDHPQRPPGSPESYPQSLTPREFCGRLQC